MTFLEKVLTGAVIVLTGAYVVNNIKHNKQLRELAEIDAEFEEGLEEVCGKLQNLKEEVDVEGL